jgi:hypothetical protein
MNQEMIPALSTLIARDLGLEIDTTSISETLLLDLVANRVAWLLEHQFEWLMSLLYRLDVDEAKARQTLEPGSPEPANIALAKLIIERQRQRILTKWAHPQSPAEEGWEW